MNGTGNDWIQTHSGRCFDYENPDPATINIEDIAHALSNITRFTGHCELFYSVAEHSLHVSCLLPPSLMRWGLLHDAAEAYLGDVNTPLKARLKEFKPLEKRIMRLIADRYGLCWPMPAAVKDADIRMVLAEREQNMGPCDKEWSLPAIAPAPITLACYAPCVAANLFLNRWFTP